jgi:hypothetical protein
MVADHGGREVVLKAGRVRAGLTRARREQRDRRHLTRAAGMLATEAIQKAGPGGLDRGEATHDDVGAQRRMLGIAGRGRGDQRAGGHERGTEGTADTHVVLDDQHVHAVQQLPAGPTRARGAVTNAGDGGLSRHQKGSGERGVAREAGDDVDEHGRIDRLGQEGVESGRQAPHPLALIGMTRHDDPARPPSSVDGGQDAAHQPATVLTGHDEIAHDHVGTHPVERGETLLGFRRCLHCGPRDLEQAPARLTARGVVIDDEDAHPGELARLLPSFFRHRLWQGVSAGYDFASARTTNDSHTFQV